MSLRNGNQLAPCTRRISTWWQMGRAWQLNRKCRPARIELRWSFQDNVKLISIPPPDDFVKQHCHTWCTSSRLIALISWITACLWDSVGSFIQHVYNNFLLPWRQFLLNLLISCHADTYSKQKSYVDVTAELYLFTYINIHTRLSAKHVVFFARGSARWNSLSNNSNRHPKPFILMN